MKRENYTLDFSEQYFHVTTICRVRLEIKVSVKESENDNFYHIIVTDKDKELNSLQYRLLCKNFVFVTDLLGSIVSTFESFYHYV